MAYQLIQRRLIQKPFKVEIMLFDEMTKVIMVYQIESSIFSIIEREKGKHGKDHKHDENTAYIMTQLDLLSKHAV